MKLRHTKRVLKNGLTVVSVPMKTESVTALMLVRVGSRDESEELNGISHFLEHMVFKGTKKWPKPTDMNKVIESVGGMVNAYTSREETGYWVKVAKEYLGLGLEYLQQSVFQPLLPKEELEKERGVIIEEINMHEDNPMHKVRREFVSGIYSMTPLGWQIIGKKENIKRLKRQEFNQYLKKWYQSKNMVLGIAGGVDKGMMEKVKQVFEGQKKGERSFGDRPKELKMEQKEARVSVVERKTEQAHFCLGVRSLKRDDKDRYALGVLSTALGGNMSSRLFEEIREKRGLVYYVRTSIDSFFETGHLVTQAGCDLRRVEEAIKVTLSEYLKLTDKKKGINKEELRRSKEYLKGMLALSLEDSVNMASLSAESLLLEGRIRTAEEIEKGIEAVRVTDVQRVGKKIFNRKDLNLTVVGPFKGKAQFEKLLK
jgi:predicted Zn-dependent peptidase